MVVNESALKHLFSSSKKCYFEPELRKVFNVRGEEEHEAFKHAIAKLEEDAFIYENKNRYLLLETQKDLSKGTITISKSGTGYIKVSDQDIVIPKSSLNGALDGDVVVVRKDGVLKDGRSAGKVERITKRKNGILIFNYENGNFIPYKVPFNFNIRLSKSDMQKITDNMRIMVKIDNSMRDGFFDAELVSIVGYKDDVDIDERTIAIENSFQVEFPDAAIKEANDLPNEVNDTDLINRLDLRGKNIFTIDGVKTKDMDDAISIEINEKGNFVLGVHIAHVSHYVKEKSPLFLSARERGTSVYMGNTCIPMFPHKLSNGICSLNPGVDRLTRSVFMEINLDGEIVDYKICKSVINSKIKMNYDDVNKVLEENVIPNEYADFKDSLVLMNKLSKILSLTKDKRGYLPFYSADSEVVFDELMSPVAFKENVSRSAEQLIENFMLVANETIAKHLYYMNYPAIYRVHEFPEKSKILELLKYINSLGYRIQNVDKIENPKILQQILNELMTLEQYPILSNLLLKSMQKAKYSTANVGHYGLALENYLHFTSPIRRFPDLEIGICLDKIDDCIFDYQTICQLEKDLENAAISSSLRERDADNAEAEALAMRMAEYMENHVDEFFNGTIVDIGSFGVLVKTENNIVGRVAFSDILGDFYVYDDDMRSLIGKKTNNCYRIGDNVRIVVKGASKEFRTIDYKLIEKVKTDKRKELKNSFFMIQYSHIFSFLF